MAEKLIELPVIEEPEKYYLALEERLKKFFKDHIYLPIIKELNMPPVVLKNAVNLNPLIDALFKGTVSYNRGIFSGRLNAGISKELRQLGAKFHAKTGTYRLALANFPKTSEAMEIKNTIAASYGKFQDTLKRLDTKLAKVIPAKLAEQFSAQDIFDKMIWKADKSFKKNVEKITIAPQLTESQRAKIAEEWSQNMDLWIRNFTEKEILSLRKDVEKSVFEGNRWGDLAKTIEKSYGVSNRKAEFLARQETRLLMAKFKEVRYTEAGVNEYKWICVKRPHDNAPPAPHIPGNVRYAHSLLDGKVFRWDTPPITTNPGESVRRNNPGQDYNCRCFGIPLLRQKR